MLVKCVLVSTAVCALLLTATESYSHSRHSGNLAMAFQTDGSFKLENINQTLTYRCFVASEPPNVATF